jgi:GTP1/Obg family GTP-binding protein
MLSEIERWHKRDSAAQAVYQVKALESRRRLKELRKQKVAAPAVVASPSKQESRPMPILQQHPETLDGISPEEMITVVSGQPRSGTSLMMQILEAAGVPPFTDKKRQADESNPKGYYEHEKVASLLSNPDSSWIRDAKGTAIKVVAPLLPSLPRKLRRPNSDSKPLHYRVLFMERNMEEILESQNTMLQGIGKRTAAKEKTADISKAYRQQERHAKSACANLGIHAMSVSFETLVHDPDQILPQLAAFLGAIHKLPAMRACIDPALYHARKSSPAATTTSGFAEARPVRALETTI